MKTKLVRYVYNHRALPKRLLSILFPKPVLLQLNGFKIYVRLDDWAVGARIAINRVYERQVTQEIRNFLKPGIVFADIGSNIGYYTLLAAASFGDSGRIIAFDPSKANCDLLKMSVAANGFKNVEIHTQAVADIEGVVGFDMDDSNGMINKSPAQSAYQVEAVRLDHVLRNEKRIDLIKMDVEGAEGLVLIGADKLVQTHHPVIFTEFRPPALEFTSDMSGIDFLDRLRALDYELSVIHKKSGAGRVPQTNAEIMECYRAASPSHIDLVAIPRQFRTR